jgi:hypothetical protein
MRNCFRSRGWCAWWHSMWFCCSPPSGSGGALIFSCCCCFLLVSSTVSHVLTQQALYTDWWILVGKASLVYGLVNFRLLRVHDSIRTNNSDFYKFVFYFKFHWDNL